MKLEQVRKILNKQLPTLKEKYKVKSIGVFGSFVRGEQKKRSDIDILVEFSEPIGLFDFITLEDFLSEKLQLKVDLVTKDALKSRIKERIIKETIYV